MSYRLFFLLVIISSFFSCGLIGKNEPEKPVPLLSASDQQLLNKVYSNLLLSVKMAGEAKNRSALPETKELAQAILTDHQMMMEELERVAAENLATLPLDITDAQLLKWQNLVREKGLAFDKAYSEIVQTQHENNIQLFISTKKSAENREIQNVANQFIATAETHKQRGSQLQEALNNRQSRDTPFIEQAVLKQ